PLIVSPCTTTFAPAANTSTPIPPAGTVTPAYTPGGAMIDTDFTMLTGPEPAESSTMTSPPVDVESIAEANERHGLITLHDPGPGGVSTPVDLTNERWPTPGASGDVMISARPSSTAYSQLRR